MSNEQIKAINNLFDSVFGRVKPPKNTPPERVDFAQFDKWAEETGEVNHHEWHSQEHIDMKGIAHGVLMFDTDDAYLSIDYEVASSGSQWDEGDKESGIPSGWIRLKPYNVIITEITYQKDGTYDLDENQIDHDLIEQYISKHTGI